MLPSILIVLLTISISSAKSLTREIDVLYQNITTLPLKLSESVNNYYNRYYLFTRNNTILPNELYVNDKSSMNSSKFDSNLLTFVIVHGWRSSYVSNLNPAIREALLNKENVNVINMDWSEIASKNYMLAVLKSPKIGAELGQFIRFLSEATKLDLTNVHLVGYSLGAHIVGKAGRELNVLVGRVTGLDPAGPLWMANYNKLSDKDGIYVEAIHTDGGFTIVGVGIATPVADVDFFVNGGFTQPGCSSSLCNHERSWQLFIVSLTHSHLVGRKCKNYLEVIFNSCRGEEFPLGNVDINKFGNGIYRLNTQDKYPY